VSKRNLGLIIFLVFLFLATWGNPASATNLEHYGNNSLQATITKLDANHPEVIRAQQYDFKLMETTQDPYTKDMTSLKWVTRTQMASSTTGIKYCTVAYEFQLANYIAIWDATPFRRTTIGAPGEVMYHRVEISRSNFVQIYARNARVSEQAIEDALAREDIIHVRAYIKIYNDKNGNNQDDPGEEVSMIMGNENEIDTKASMFPYENRQDMHSRFQQVLIHPQGKPVPDFFSTPEGSTQWQESYKTCAKRYSGKSGTQIKVPITLRNSGAAGTTSLGASWWGSGWSNPVIPVQNVFVPEGGSKAFTFTVTVPAQGQEIRLVFCCNIDGNSPANEVNRDNNLTVIEVTSNGLPGTPPGSADDSKVGYIAVVPCTKTIFTGDYYDFKAHYHKPEGSSVEVTEQSTWEVSNSSVAKLETKKGRVKALKPGTLVLSATYKGMTGTADVTVIDEPLPPPPNYSPKADFSISNPSPVEGEKVYFWDESTHEGERYGESIISWEWTIKGQPGSSSQNTEATWNEVGTYSITLRVEDQDGDSDSCTKSVVVGPALPAAVIQVDPRAVILGRKVNINGDQSTAANGRTIKWDEMQWEFIKPNGTKVTFTGRYPTPDRVTTNSLINQTGIWKVRLKVKDSDNNESEWAEDIFTVYPDNRPQARFWSITETLRYSYENNEIIIRDLSTSGNPDAALGDEISARDWTLYYDSNNNGVFTDPEDEIILPGQVKSAQIIQQSGNDPNPKIRFYKTGLYKLELSVTESYLDGWDNTLKPGLSANTNSMPEAEKTTMVINIAPTVAFDIKKKTPVDILFAADYTVTDSKYGNLQSSQAGFINGLEGGFIEPEVGMERAVEGDMTLILDEPTPFSHEHWAIEGPYYKNLRTTNEPSWRNIQSGYHNSFSGFAFENFHINIYTGEILSGFLSAPSFNSYVYTGYTRASNDPKDINIVGKTKNNKFTITAERNLFKVLNGFGQIVTSQDVPGSNAREVLGQYFKYPDNILVPDRPLMIAPWGDSKTVVFYQNAIYEKNKYITKTDYIYLYLLNNETGQVIARHDFTNFYADYTRTDRSDLGLYRIEIQKLGSELIGIRTETIRTDETSDRVHEIHIIDKNYNQTQIDSIGRTSRKSDYDVNIHPINDNVFLSVKYEGYKEASNIFSFWKYNETWDYWYNAGILRFYRVTNEWRYSNVAWAEYLPYFATYDDGYYINTYRDTNINKFVTQYYDNNGNLVWQLQTDNNIHVPRHTIGATTRLEYMNEYRFGTAKRFMNYVVLTDTFGGDGSVTHLVNPSNGQIVQTLPYKWLGHDDTFLLLQEGMETDTVLKGYCQLQGLQYLKQAIENHHWHTNKFNVVVSVIDGDSFKDLEAQKADIQSLLHANNLKLAVISPSVGKTKSQSEQIIAKNAEGGWWINTNNKMSVPLNELADKIIQAVNEERGADNVVLVGQEVELGANYNDAEDDWPGEIEWKFLQDPAALSGMDISNPQGYSTNHNTTQIVNPSPVDGSFAPLSTQFDKPGTWKVYCKAKDNPNTTASYMKHPKAGSKWSNEDAYLTVIVHRKPIARFTVTGSTSNKPGDQLVIQDNSYDPDLQYTDPMNMKGLRVWEWQYRKDGGNWETEYCYDNSGPRGFKSSGNYELRLRVQDNFGAWSDWTDTSPIAIINRPPIADFTVIPNPVAVNHIAMITDCSYDPDGDPIVSYEWAIQTPSGNDVFTRNNPASFPYTWAVAGDYRVTLKVTDSEGLSATTTQIVKVSEKQPPVAVIRIPNEVFTDEWFNADGTGSYAFDGNIIVKAFWQYLKPGTADWTSVHEQDVAALRPGEIFLKYPIYPKEGEQGQWRVSLQVQDNEGLYSNRTEAEFLVQDGWQISGQIIPEVGERGRYMIVAAYAHRKDKPNEKYQIDSMKAELAYLDPACTTSGRAVAEGMETLNMPYDANKADFRVKYLVGQKIYVTDRWPADGTYYIKITGQKGTTRKEIALPFSIKGNIWERFYIQTRSW
jgi:hypothetical protein